MELLSIDEWNNMMVKQYEDAGRPRHNGIECPNCHEELVDSHPSVVLNSFPPKKHIECLACGYKGHALN